MQKIQLPDFTQANIVVVGDVMLDRYWYGGTSRISPEAPVPVVHVNQGEDRPGGAGNVALNISALGAKATLIGFVGDDPEADALEKLLDGSNVTPLLVRNNKVPTVTKLRVMSQRQQLIRLDFESGFPEDVGKPLANNLKKALESADLVVISDYSKGITPWIASCIELANKKKVPVLVDPKQRDFSCYQGATMVKPNWKEFIQAVGPCYNEEEVVEKGNALLKDHQIDSLLITRGEAGMTLLQHDAEPFYQATRAREVFDVTGAGDTVIATLACAIASGEQLSEATKLANIAAGIVVAKSGTATVSPTELHRAVRENHIGYYGAQTEELVLAELQDARAKGDKIVMTNGCFDILHPGHITYLEEARALGDRLVVAVNADESVKRLKGDSRPINPLEHRMAILEGLSAVDWVVSFSEDTPENIIKRVVPDVLVKGGDWQASEIVGGDFVIANGGEVKSLQFVEGFSTTSIVEKILAEGEA